MVCSKLKASIAGPGSNLIMKLWVDLKNLIAL